MKTLLLFIDGLGIGEKDPGTNPLYGGAYGALTGLLDQSKPIDAALGVPGLPQSATGQTSLLTGINAPEAVGRHVEGYPGPQLKEIIREHNIFNRMLERGYTATFANAYYLDKIDSAVVRRYQSVTTVSTLHAFNTVRDSQDMKANKAVYQDLTRHVLLDRGYEGPTISPCEAGQHLLDIADDHDFTLFEYFQTDLMAHKNEPDLIHEVLSKLNEFVAVAQRFGEREDSLFIMTSDHGNIEDNRTRQHTANPVPFVTIGAHAEAIRAQVNSLIDVVPALLEFYPAVGSGTPAE